MYKYAKYMHENLVKLATKYEKIKRNKGEKTKITIEPGRKRQKSPQPCSRLPPIEDKCSPRLQQLSGLLEKIADLEAFMNDDEDFC